MKDERRIFVVEVEKCIACGKCEIACAFAHGSPSRPSRSRIHIVRKGPEVGIPVVCIQCDEAECVKVCPVGALARNEVSGAIEMLRARCIRCRHCVQACPFGNILWDDTYHCVQKCDLCGGEPRCVPFCPAGAIAYVPAERVAVREDRQPTQLHP